MSSSFPKSESTTSLLKSSAVARKPTHLPEKTAESRRSQHQHQHQHQHHHRPAALRSSSSKAEDCDTSARRPLCHPSLTDSQDSSDNAATRDKCKSHVPHSQVTDAPNGEASRSVRERGSRASKPAHRHHHRRRQPHNREERAPPAGAPEPEHPRPSHIHTRPLPRVPSLSDSNDDRAPLCEPRGHKGASLSHRGGGGGQVASPSPSSCSLVPLSSRSSRRSRRSSAASSTSDINLRTILNSLFGQRCFFASPALYFVGFVVSGFMGLTETRVCTPPPNPQTVKLTEKKSPFSFSVSLLSLGVGRCYDWPLRT
ncbi:hypothetical protein JOB18_026318, partial [Solea senegalensis]